MGRRGRARGATRAHLKATASTRYRDGRPHQFRWIGRLVTVTWPEDGPARYRFDPPLTMATSEENARRLKNRRVRALPRGMHLPIPDLAAMAKDQAARDELERMAEEEGDDGTGVAGDTPDERWPTFDLRGDLDDAG